MARTLKRSLSLPLVTLYGLGNILGAGIYVLVGKVAGEAGSGTLLAFIVAMAIAGLTALSYMELSSRFPVSASVSVYLHKAFGLRLLAVTAGLAMVLGGISSAAALSHGFAGYLSTVFDVPQLAASIGLLIALGLVAAKGIGESARLAGLFTLVEIAGLVLVIWAGRAFVGSAEALNVFSLDPGLGVSGMLFGAFLAFYAFIGFEDMVNVAEEVKNPRRVMPLAILFSLLAATALYLMVVIVSLSVATPGELAASDAPLTFVADKSGGLNPNIISAIGMAAAVNGILVQIIMGSRMLYGLARQGWILRDLSEVNKVSRTPVLATFVVVGTMILAAILLPLVSLAQVTSFLVLGIFTLVNIALIVIKRRHPGNRKLVRVPAIVPYAGAASCLSIIVFQLLAG